MLWELDARFKVHVAKTFSLNSTGCNVASKFQTTGLSLCRGGLQNRYDIIFCCLNETVQLGISVCVVI